MTPDEARAVAHQLSRRYNASLDAVRANRDVSEDHRTALLAAVWVEYAQAFTDIQGQVSQATQTQRTELEAKYLQPKRSLMTSPSERVAMDASYRDALARAGDTGDTDSLQRLLTRALRVGDELQAKAALAIAYERMDVDAINVFAATQPDAEPELQRLYDLSVANHKGEARADLLLSMQIAPPNPPVSAPEADLRQMAAPLVSGDPKRLIEEAKRAAKNETPIALNDGPALASVATGA